MELSLLPPGKKRYRPHMLKLLALLLAGGILGLPVRAAETIRFAAHFTNTLPVGWQNVAFFKTPTDYQAVTEGTNHFVRGRATNTCSGLSCKLAIAPPQKLTLRWRWRIAGVNTNGSERELKKFDHAARVFLAFDTFIGPPRTLNYLWGNVEKPGTVLAHPKSGRAQIFVVESGNEKAGQWQAESRDVSADWRRAFPDLPMPKIVGIGIMTDNDSLGMPLTGDYADMELVGE
jgi:hypothetical protein